MPGVTFWPTQWRHLLTNFVCEYHSKSTGVNKQHTKHTLGCHNLTPYAKAHHAALHVACHHYNAFRSHYRPLQHLHVTVGVCVAPSLIANRPYTSPTHLTRQKTRKPRVHHNAHGAPHEPDTAPTDRLPKMRKHTANGQSTESAHNSGHYPLPVLPTLPPEHYPRTGCLTQTQTSPSPGLQRKKSRPPCGERPLHTLRTT